MRSAYDIILNLPNDVESPESQGSSSPGISNNSATIIVHDIPTVCWRRRRLAAALVEAAPRSVALVVSGIEPRMKRENNELMFMISMRSCCIEGVVGSGVRCCYLQ